MTSSIKLATVRDILGDIQGLGGTTDQQLAALFEKFNVAARAIDPSITGSWVGYDANRPNTPTYVIFERPGADVFRRSA